MRLQPWPGAIQRIEQKSALVCLSRCLSSRRSVNQTIVLSSAPEASCKWGALKQETE